MMAIICDMCQAFASMSTQNILDHHSGCKAKCDKECAEHEGPTKTHKKKKKSQGLKEASQLQVQMLQRSHKVWNAALHLPSSQAIFK